MRLKPSANWLSSSAEVSVTRCSKSPKRSASTDELSLRMGRTTDRASQTATTVASKRAATDAIMTIRVAARASSRAATPASRIAANSRSRI